MNIISKLFSFLSGKKFGDKSEDNSTQSCSKTDSSSTETCHESGTFCRESRVDQIASPFPGILTESPDNGRNDSETITTVITRTLDRWNPETCVRLLRMPSVQNYSGLCKLISESDRNWMIEFLDMGGLNVLFESVDRLSSKNSYSSRLERTLLLLQCVKCLKAVVNSHIALQYIIQQRIYVQKIAEVLSSCNPLVKKQLFDFMSTLCIYSEEGHYLTIDVFESYRVRHKLRYRFAVLLIEIKQAEVMPYVGAVLGLINCIILGACGFRFRTRLRNEFLALGLQDLLESLNQITDEEVELQCSVFLKSQLADEEYARSMGINSSFSHFALFQALLDKIEDTPLSASLLFLLQNLNQLDPSDTKTDYVWSILEEVTEKALNGTGSLLRSWIQSECRRNSLRSTATQVCLCPPSLYIEDSVTHQKFPLCDEDCEKESVKSFGSRDSGIPVSRNQSFAGSEPRAHDNTSFSKLKPIDTHLACPVQSSSYLNRVERLSDGELSNTAKENVQCFAVEEKAKTTPNNIFKPMGLSFALTNNSSKETQTDLLKGNSHDIQPEISPSPYRSESPIPKSIILVEEGKPKKTFTFPFFSRSKKYSFPKCPPTVTINLPSPDAEHSIDTASSRNGMTSIDVKRSRKQTQISSNLLQENSSVTFEDKSTSEIRDLQSQNSSKGEYKMLNSVKQVEHSSNFPSDLKQTILPPPPPPPPPGLSEVAFRPKSQFSLELPGNKNLRSSWSGNPTIKEFEKMERRQRNTLPMPKSKMRTLNWTKIPSTHVSVHSIWNEINSESEVIELNFEEMERLFCQNEPRRKETKIQQRKRATSEISLLDNKRCLSICVFLKQFKGGLEEVIEYVRQCKYKEIGGERLRTLLNLLPDSNEIKLLNSYVRDMNKLGTAEKFLIRLTAIDRYDCLVEGMLLLEEFPTTIQILHDSVQNLLEACQELLTNTGFKNFLKLVLVTGNFMNTGSYAGNAMGFRLSTLPKLLETRANKPRITLLHYLVEETQKKCVDSIKFTKELLEKLSKCSRLTVESLSIEITQLDKTMQKLNAQMEVENGQLKKYFSTFTENGIKHLNILKSKMQEIRGISVQLANRFSEDEKKFKLEECLNIVSAFCAKIKIADSENQARTKVEEKKT